MWIHFIFFVPNGGLMWVIAILDQYCQTFPAGEAVHVRRSGMGISWAMLPSHEIYQSGGARDLANKFVLRKNCGRSRRNPKKLGQQQRGVASKFATTKAWQKMRGLRCAFKIVYIWLYDGVFSNYCTSVIACSFPDGIAKFQHGRLVDATLVGRETWTTD